MHCAMLHIEESTSRRLGLVQFKFFSTSTLCLVCEYQESDTHVIQVEVTDWGRTADIPFCEDNKRTTFKRHGFQIELDSTRVHSKGL